MKKKEVRDLVYKGLNEVLTSEGFRLKKGEESFVKSISEGQQRIYVSFIDYQPEFIFSLTMAIRLDAVEQIFHLFSGSSPKYQHLSTTTLTQLDYFIEARTKEYRVSTEAEISVAVDDLSTILNNRIIPFFERHCDIRAVETQVNSNSLIRFDSTQLPSGAMHSIILAYLAGNPNFDLLVQQYQHTMKDFPAREKDKFNQLAEYLKNYSSHDN